MYLFSRNSSHPPDRTSAATTEVAGKDTSINPIASANRGTQSSAAPTKQAPHQEPSATMVTSGHDHGVQTDLLDVDTSQNRSQKLAGSEKLEHQAATAALYVTKYDREYKHASSSYPLDEDQRLSAAGKSS